MPTLNDPHFFALLSPGEQKLVDSARRSLAEASALKAIAATRALQQACRQNGRLASPLFEMAQALAKRGQYLIAITAAHTSMIYGIRGSANRLSSAAFILDHYKDAEANAKKMDPETPAGLSLRFVRDVALYAPEAKGKNEQNPLELWKEMLESTPNLRVSMQELVSAHEAALDAGNAAMTKTTTQIAQEIKASGALSYQLIPRTTTTAIRTLFPAPTYQAAVNE